MCVKIARFKINAKIYFQSLQFYFIRLLIGLSEHKLNYIQYTRGKEKDK